MLLLASMAALSFGLSTKPRIIQCYGDSLTAGLTSNGMFPYSKTLQATLRASGMNVEVRAAGLSGWTADSLVDAVDDPHGLNFILKTKPFDLAIIMAGTNDLGQPTLLEQHERAGEIASNIWKLHGFVHKNMIRTLAISVPESMYQAQVKKAAELSKRVNVHLEENCNQEALCTFVECPVKFDEHSERTGLWEDDGLHMSAMGYAELGKALASIVSELLSQSAMSTRD
jgi:lysophospholipase L1-like esterase